MLNSKRSILIFNWGASFNGPVFWIGLILILFSIFMFTSEFSFWIFSLPIMIIGLIAILNIKGASLNIKKKEVRFFSNFILFKIHYNTKNIEAFDLVELRLFNQSQNMNMRSISTTTLTKVYEIYLVSKTLHQRCLIYETTNLKQARAQLFLLQNSLKIKSKESLKR